MEFERVESWVQAAVEWLRLSVELLGAIVIAVGVAVAVAQLLRKAFSRRRDGFADVRLSFARFLMMALELQLAADILSTSIAPTWDRIGKLGAIAVIRTALNYFLARELRGELAAGGAAEAARTSPTPSPARAPDGAAR